MDLQVQQAQYQIPTDDYIKKKIESAIDVLSKISPSSQQIKTSNQVIIKFLHQPQSLQVLLNLLISAADNQIHCNIIISFINYYIKVQVRPGVGVTRHDKQHICKKIKNIFFCQTVSDKSKRMLLAGFQQFLGTLSPQFIKIRKALCEEIVKYFSEQKNVNAVDLQNSLYLIQALVTKSLQTQSLRIIQQNLLLKFINLSLQLVRGLNKQLSLVLNSIIEPGLAQKLIWTQKVMKITSLLYISADIDKLALLKSTLMISPNLAHMCIQSFKLSVKAESKVFMISKGQCDKYQTLNTIKCEVLKIVLDTLKFMIKGKKNFSDTKYVPVFATIKQFLGYIPVLVAQVQQYPIKKLSSDQLLKHSLLLLSKTAIISFLLNQHTQIRDLVLFSLCLPILISSNQDKNLSAEDFCNKRQKMINFQEPLNIHQAAVSLIESYADQVYGTVPYLTKSMINLMDFQLTADPRYFQQMPTALIESQFYKNHTYFQHFQVALSILALLSYHAERRDDLTVTVQEFIVRRQQFFSRIDVPEQLIVSFLHFCSYYLENFYQLILQGKANASFHRSLIFHAIQLLNASVNKQTKSYINNNTKKIGIQAIDYLSNCIIQPYFFSAIFPAWNQNSTEMLVNLMDKICTYFSYSCNISILEDVIIDFVNICIERHYKQANNYAGMPEVLKNQLSFFFVKKIIQNFCPQICNQTIAKQKMLELYSTILIFCKNPTQILQTSADLLKHIIQIEYSFIEQFVDIIQIYLYRLVKQKHTIKLNHNLQQIILKGILKSMKICDNQKFQNQVFDIVLNLNSFQFGQQELIQCLMEVFQERLTQKDVDQQAEIIMEKTLYLILQIAFNNFSLVNAKTWIKILERMIQFLRAEYKAYDTITVGKAICICLCCYVQDPEGIQSFLNNRIEGLWDCILDDHLKYRTTTQKKIVCLTLLNLAQNHSSRKVITDKFPFILKTVCSIMYYLYQKNQISWKSQDSQSDSDGDAQNKSEKSKQKKPWKQPLNKIRDNIFLKSLSDERILLRNICHYLNQNNHQSFTKFIKDLPIALQNLVKNKIMLYREDLANTNKKKMRTLVKVRKIEQENN